MKFSNIRNTLILIVVFGALLGYFLLVEKNKETSPSTSSSPAASSAKVFDFSSSDALQLEVNDNAKRTVVKRDDEKSPWKLIEPQPDEADSTRVDSTIEKLSSLMANRVFTETEVTGDLAAFGLVKPKMNATVKLKGGKEAILHIGDNTPEGVNTYVQKEGDKAVYVVGMTLSSDLNQMLSEPPIKPTPTPTLPPTSTPTLTSTMGITVTPALTLTPAAEMTPTPSASQVLTPTLAPAASTTVAPPTSVVTETPVITTTLPTDVTSAPATTPTP